MWQQLIYVLCLSSWWITVNYMTTADICYFVVSYLLIMFAVPFKIMSHVIACYVDAAILTFVWQVVGGMASCLCDEMYMYVCHARHEKLYLQYLSWTNYHFLSLLTFVGQVAGSNKHGCMDVKMSNFWYTITLTIYDVPM